MNYLSHFAINHLVWEHPVEPEFVLGVAIPDMWSRVSRKRRIHWPSVRAANPDDPGAEQLRQGLLNHVAVDATFHLCGSFLRWQTELAERQPRDRHHAVRDFLAHVAIELALDHHLLNETPDLADRFYDALTKIDLDQMEARVSHMGRVDASGLHARATDFIQRGYLHSYVDPLSLRTALRFVMGLVRVELEPVDDAGLDEVVEGAIELADPAQVWQDLKGCAAARPFG